MKSEPSEVSIDDVAASPDGKIGWFGVRNYEARNFMRDDMKKGDLGFFYHSSCAVPGIAGVVVIDQESHPDPTQFDPQSPYFDPKSDPKNPRWMQVQVRFLKKTTFLPLSKIREVPELASLRLLQRGNRLSITPVSSEEARVLLALIAVDLP